MEDFVTFEQAIKLKELGFKCPCNHYYSLDGGLLHEETENSQTNYIHCNSKYLISAPTLGQAQKWLREKEIEVGVSAEFDGELRTGQWVWLMREFTTHLFDTVFPEDINYDTYEEALSKGIDEALNYLINKKKENIN